MSDGLEEHLHHQTRLATGFFWHRLRWRAVEDLLPSGVPFRLLDVGAGNGVMGDFLASERPGATYLFDEPIGSLAGQLEQRFGESANHRTHPQWKTVDIVTLLDVIEHLDDPHSLLERICHECRPGTVVAITVPASERLWSQWDVTLGHRRRYTPDSLNDLLTDLPLDVAEVSWLFPELMPAGLWRAWRNPPRTSPPNAPEATASDETETSAEFPDLPRLVNSGLYYLGLLPLRLRRWIPFGTSLLAAARVRGGSDPEPGAGDSGS